MSTKRAHARSPSSRSESPPPCPIVADPALVRDFAARGWVCLPSLLSRSELHVLQTECNALYACQSAESVAAHGCVLDAMAQYPMQDSDAARVDAESYLDARAGQLKSVGTDVFGSLLFKKLPAVAEQLMIECKETEASTFFFNEHYVVKPPQSHVEFRWHRDDDEQLAMCVHRDSIHPYVSAWCALDDVTRFNGALQFVSLDLLTKSGGESLETLQRLASEPVTAKAGDVLFFLSNVWHCSLSNESDAPRRAFYAQYTSEKVTARPKDLSPLSFAIPCSTTTGYSIVGAASTAIATCHHRSTKKSKNGVE